MGMGRGLQQVNIFWSVKNGGTETGLRQETNGCVNLDVANMITGVDLNFEKGLK